MPCGARHENRQTLLGMKFLCIIPGCPEGAGDSFAMLLHRKTPGQRLLSGSFFVLHIKGLHAQNGMAYLAEVVQQFLGILGADGFIGDKSDVSTHLRRQRRRRGCLR